MTTCYVLKMENQRSGICVNPVFEHKGVMLLLIYQSLRRWKDLEKMLSVTSFAVINVIWNDNLSFYHFTVPTFNMIRKPDIKGRSPWHLP